MRKAQMQYNNFNIVVLHKIVSIQNDNKFAECEKFRNLHIHLTFFLSLNNRLLLNIIQVAETKQILCLFISILCFDYWLVYVVCLSFIRVPFKLFFFLIFSSTAAFTSFLIKRNIYIFHENVIRLYFSFALRRSNRCFYEFRPSPK